MATLEEGRAALQRGDAAGAIAELEPVCQQDPENFLAHMLLGAAYGISGRNDEAIGAITRAVQLQPSNAQARFNLGVALERAGWPNEALTAFEQAVALQPDYTQAQQCVARLQAQLQSPQAAPVAPTQQMPAQPGTQEVGLAAYNQAPHNAPPARPAPGSLPGAAPTVQLPYSPAQPGVSTYAGYPTTPVVEDRFNLLQAFKDWGRVIVAPGAFFADQRGREGLKAPMAMLLVYSLVGLVFTLIGDVIHPSSTNAAYQSGAAIGGYFGAIIGALIVGGMFHLIGNAFGNQAPYAGSVRAWVYSRAPGVLLGLFAVLLMTPPPANPAMGFPPPGPSSAAPVHVYAAQFSGRQPRGSGGMMGAPGGPGMPGGMAPGGPNAFGAPGTPGGAYAAPNANPMAALNSLFNPWTISLMMIGGVWSFVLLIIALPQIQGISSGAAVGVVLLTGLIGGVIAVVLMFVAGAAIFAMLMGAKGAAGAAGAGGGFAAPGGPPGGMVR